MDEGSLYTLMMVDPDAPCRKHPVARSWMHWLVVNIKGDVTNGDTISDYQPPAPPCGSGYHRYTFLAYKQNGSIDKDSIKISARAGFNVNKFHEKNQLSDIIGFNYFKTQHE